MLKLYHSPTSPYVRKVMILLHESGLLPDVELVSVMGSPLQAGTLPVDKNPLGKIPALERPDGPILYDSRVICRYLDDRADHKFYPNPPQLWQTLTLEATAEGMLDAALLIVYESRLRPENKRLPEWVEGQWSKISRSLKVLDSNYIAHLKGPIDMGHISVATALGYLDFRHPQRNWRLEHGDLAEWFAEISERPSLQATLPPV